jgi:putative transposase
MLGAEIIFCEPGEPNQKPHVEAFFRTWSTQIVHCMSGTTFSNITARGDYNSEKNATYTLDKVKEVFVRWLDTYHQDWHSELGMSPNEAWAKCLESEFEPRRYSEDDLRHYFWRMEMVTPSSQGRVRYSNVHWTGGAVSALAKRHPIRKKLMLYYDPSDLGKAWIVHPDYPTDIQDLQPVHKEYQEGLTLHFHQEIQKRKRAERKNHVYISAHEARLRILWDISQMNNKSDRAKYHRALERGDVTPAELENAIRPQDSAANTATPRVHEYRDDTPDEFTVVRR